MHRILSATVSLCTLALASTACANDTSEEVAATIVEVAQDGDIIFHKSQSSQAAALRDATGSDYTHVGLLYEREGDLQVLEAVEPVRWTSPPTSDLSIRGRVLSARWVRTRRSSGFVCDVESSTDGTVRSLCRPRERRHTGSERAYTWCRSAIWTSSGSRRCDGC